VSMLLEQPASRIRDHLERECVQQACGGAAVSCEGLRSPHRRRPS
jgi:hypothetical protein